MKRIVSLYGPLVALVLCAPAHALTTRCVNTVAELESAYRASEDDDVRINVVQGTYNLAGTAFDSFTEVDMDGDVTIVGGYTSTACSGRNVNPELTVLSGNGNSYFSIRDGGEIKLVSLTLRAFSDIGFGAVDVGAVSSADHDVRLERVRFDSNGLIGLTATRSFLQSVAVVRAVDTIYNCAIEFKPYSVDLELVRIENSLFADNADRAVCINRTSADLDWGAMYVYNTIFWNNGSDDIYTRSDEDESLVVLRSSVYTDISIEPPSSSTPIGTLASNPQFVNAANGDYRLANASPSRDSGTQSLPSGVPSSDIQGLARPIGTIDRGPHENQSAGTLFNYTVTNTNDANAGSLRQAMLDAQSTAGFNGISFNIAGSGCPKVITVASPLPEITQDLVINGASQPGSTRNGAERTFDADVCIVLQSGSGLSPDKAFVVPDGAPSSAAASFIGLGFSGFDQAIDLRGGGGHQLYGNQFGGSVGAVNLAPNDYSVRVTRTTSPILTGVQIGGDDPEQRNLMGGANAAAISLNGGFVRDTQVINNFVGLAANGASASPNGYGIFNIGTVDSTIRDNWIAGNVGDGLVLSGTLAYVQGNQIGLRAVVSLINPQYDQGNGLAGIRVSSTASGPSENVIGSGITTSFGVPIATGSGNAVAYNGEGGIRVASGVGHRLSRNLVYSNTGQEIDIGAEGYSANDNDGAAGAASLSNRGLNAPALASVIGNDNNGTATGTLSSTNGTYRIEVYSSSSSCPIVFPSLGQARAYHNARTVTIGNAVAGQNGSATFTVPVASNNLARTLSTGRGFVALAIDADGNTSELGQCRGYFNNGILFANGFE